MHHKKSKQLYKSKGCNFPVNETLSKLYKVDNFMLTKEFMQKWSIYWYCKYF